MHSERLFSNDVKRAVMEEIKNLRNDVKFVDNITQNNNELMKRLRESEKFEAV